MNQALLHRKRIDERLQRRARRAASHDAIDLTENVLVEKLNRSDVAEHFSRRRMNQQRARIGDPDLTTQPDVVRQRALDDLLLRQVDEGSHNQCVT